MRKILTNISSFFKKSSVLKYLIIGLSSLVTLSLVFFVVKFYLNNLDLKNSLAKNSEHTSQIQVELDEIKNHDQVKVNIELKKEIASIETTYSLSISLYEEILALKDKKVNTKELDELYAKIVSELSNKDWQKAGDDLKILEKKIKESSPVSTSGVSVDNITSSNTPPGSGYSRQSVTTDAGSFAVSLIAADLSTTKVIVDTASDSTCTNDCPVLPLGTYVSRSGAFAGINGSYFCPSTYPSCVGKTNSFDLLVMNKNKTYFNSDNNVYSTNPAVVFGNGYIRFLSQTLEWGRDTGIDSMLSNYPLLLSGGNVVFSGSSDSKLTNKGNRSFVASKGSTVYIGVVHSATVLESAKALQALGMQDALNLDDGGSTALWSGGYKVGPGRDIPNAILFVRK